MVGIHSFSFTVQYFFMSRFVCLNSCWEVGTYHLADRLDSVYTFISTKGKITGKIMNNEKYSLLLGLAKKDITPPVGVLLAGYKARKSVSLGHKLRVEALVCKGRKRSWVLIACDLIGFKGDYVRSIREEISEKIGVPTDSVAICGTHTHSVD